MASINERIRALRLDKRLTLQQLAALSKLTKSYLSKIERGHQPPPISTLQTIAGALGVDMDAFFGSAAAEREPASANLDLLRAAERAHPTGESRRVLSYHPLISRFHNKYMSPFLMRIEAGATDFFTHDSEEFVYVVQGELDFLYEEKTHLLRPGDSLYFNSREKHAFRNRGETEAVLVTVNFNYKRF